MSYIYEWPRIDVCVEAVIIHPLDSTVLLLQRAEEPLKGDWCGPGGHVDPGESLEWAFRREVKEETGLLVRPAKWLGSIVEPETDRLIVAGFCVAPFPPIPTLSAEHTSFIWTQDRPKNISHWRWQFMERGRLEWRAS